MLIDTRQHKWDIDGKRTPVDVGAARRVVHRSLHTGLNRTLSSWASTKSSDHLSGLVSALNHYHRTMCVDEPIFEFNEAAIATYSTRLVKEFGHEDYLARIRSFLKHWAALRLPGVSRELVEALKDRVLTRREYGRAVTTMDPSDGPFTVGELQALNFDLCAAAESGKISLSDASLLAFHLGTGRRPDQTANLKCSDVDRSRLVERDSNAPEGPASLIIAVPRAKGQGETFRESLRGIHAEEAFFALMEAQKDSVQVEFVRRLAERGLQLNPEDHRDLLRDLPLYPRWTSIYKDLEKIPADGRDAVGGETLRRLRDRAALPVWHCTSERITYRLQRAVEIVGTKSRTGERLHANASRFRYTRGTELARLGASVEVIAWLLDHSNVRSAGIYVDSLPEHGAAINEALKNSGPLSAVASAFSSKILCDEDIVETGDLAGRIQYKGRMTAQCGVQMQCGMAGGIPLACYTCNNFRPWIDGPHELILDELLRERSQDVAVLGEENPVTRRRDATIVAVIVVIRRCRDREDELKKGRSDQT